jgi:hypothetical protein
MGLEQNNEQHYREVVDKFVDPAVSYQMSARDYVVRPSATNASNAIIITLPPVAEAKGRFYSILSRQADAVNTITITDANDSECWLADIVFDGKCDRILLYSDGLCWHPLGAGGPGEWPGLASTAAPGTSEAPTTAARETTAPPTTTETTAAPVQSTLAPTT